MKAKMKKSRVTNMNINVVKTCIDIPECMIAQEIRHAMQADDYLITLTAFVRNGWPSTRG